MKQYNGNIEHKNLKVMQWNLGNRNWENKQTDVQALVNEFSPDICFITEANMNNDIQEHFKVIQGYNMIFPLTRDNPELLYSRIIGLVKQDINVKVLTDHMSQDISSIWLKLIKKGPKKSIIGGTYREHRYLHQNDDSSAAPAAQVARWNKTVAQWLEASRDSDCTLLGDCNIDILKWQNPDPHLGKLINILENKIITQGFTQLIHSPTRFWPGCPSSIIDHIWTNCPLKIRNHRNISRSSSDHNVTEVTIASKTKFLNVQESLVRKKCSLTPGQLCDEMKIRTGLYYIVQMM